MLEKRRYDVRKYNVMWYNEIYTGWNYNKDSIMEIFQQGLGH